ncbi:hypothetical protein ACERIT_01115 [Halopenitus sp. H-Gu1]|uniref:hypothetical protein n=1 Tax=Halopenitus sp. H-Gu1 TaxID=3242697 RepID=UPI00359E4C27
MRNAIVVLLVLVASVGLVVGTSGFSSIAAERSVTVDVVGDENAYMALEYPDETIEVDEGERSTFLTVSNQFTQPVDFTIEYEIVDANGVSADPNPGERRESNVGVGESFDVSVLYTCDSVGDESATVSFHARAIGSNNGSVSAETTKPRTVDYEIDCGDLEVTFQGNGGNAQVDGIDTLTNTNATVWTLTDGETDSKEVDLSKTGKNVRPSSNDGENDAAIVAVYLPETHETHVHSKLERNEYGQLTIENQSGGSNEPGDPVCSGNVDPDDLGDDGNDLICPV